MNDSLDETLDKHSLILVGQSKPNQKDNHHEAFAKDQLQ